MAANSANDLPVVFLGPSLPRIEAEQALAAHYLPPASQGSVVRAVLDYRPPAIVLIDGAFQGEPAVRHKEILWALSQGIPVFGASSMGALRAAELAPFGMTGIGLIYRWYRRFPLLADDAVAVLHGPAELGSMPLTTSLVDLRRTFRRAEREGVIDAQQSARLCDVAAMLNFRDRTILRAVERAVGLKGDSSRALEIVASLTHCIVMQKKGDALAALRLVAKLIDKGGLPKPNPIEFVTTTTFIRDLVHSGIRLT
ncbi:TfuA domain-containing protein [Stappia sp. F7233]|uniref:TfuA domain-containing protein n=1 Tax=Stappia albiluteola TaxID=2758565 RepID=A0A839ACP4_9HYPH|nr:TfuA-like protein [Stappia albiluteola]MBA5776702.1 TfuA domain-containing protein [Stappia albiluteola]